jgi:hypothetical protein
MTNLRQSAGEAGSHADRALFDQFSENVDR